MKTQLAAAAALTLVCGSLLFIGKLSSSSKRFTIDTFSSSTAGSLPKDWHGRDDTAERFYEVASEKSGNKYLRVRNQGTHQFVLKEAHVDIAQFPYLNWKWRAHSLPPKGNESVKEFCDSAASVSVVIHGSKWRPKSIKYSWSTTLKEGTVTSSPYCTWPAQCDIIVLRSGASKAGPWLPEKRNVLEDYKKLYGEEDVESLVIDGILVMSDGDNTNSLSAADYDDIVFSK